MKNLVKSYTFVMLISESRSTAYREKAYGEPRDSMATNKKIRILEDIYKDISAAVRINGDLSNWFQTIVGVLQGSVISPLLFNIFLEVIMVAALSGHRRKRDKQPKICGRHWTNG